jgi:mRNA interferase YafQ
VLDFSFNNIIKKDLKLMQKRKKNMDKIYDIMSNLIWGDPLPARCREHMLHGDLDGFTECHIEGDWLMYYMTDGKSISFTRTGTHSDLF